MAQEPEQGKERKRRLSKRWIVIGVLALCVAFVTARIVRLVTAKPTIAVDYAARYNELARPVDCDPCDNAAPLYATAFAILADAPEDHNTLEMIVTASEMPYWWCERSCIDWSGSDANSPLAAQMVGFRRAALRLREEAIWHAEDGDIEQALQTVTTIGKMARHMGGRHATRNQVLVATALNGLAQYTARRLLAEHDIEADLLDRFQRHTEAILAQPISLCWETEELQLLDAIQRSFTDNGKGDGQLIVGRIFDEYRRMEELPNELADAFAYLKHLHIALRHPSRAGTVQLLEDLIAWIEELSQQTPWELHRRDTSYEGEIRKRIAGNYFLELIQLDRRLGRTLEILSRMQVAADALTTTIALLRYQRGEGHWPESLDVLLDAGYIRHIPIDPFSDEALVYKPTGETFLLYSFGADFDDDGGASSNWGQGADGGDQVFWPFQEN